MGMIGSAIGAGATIAGGIIASNAVGKVQKNLEQQLRENQDLYDRRYNEDATQRADAVRMLQMTEDSIKNRNRQSAGASAVMGGTEESVANAKQVNNQALADATSQIVAQAGARKDQIEQNYLTAKSDIQGKLNDMTLKKAEAVGDAVKGVGEVASSMPF